MQTNPPPTGMSQAEDPFPPRSALAPMSLRARWRLGCRVLSGMRLLLLPFWLLWALFRFLDRQSTVSPGIVLALGLACMVGLPLWVAMAWREWAASGEVEQLVEEARAGQEKLPAASSPTPGDAA